MAKKSDLKRCPELEDGVRVLGGDSTGPLSLALQGHHHLEGMMESIIWFSSLLSVRQKKIRRGGGPLVISHKCQVNLLVNLCTKASYAHSS